MASTKRVAPSEDEHQEASKKTKVDDDVPSFSSCSESSRKQRVALNRADCALDFIIEGDELKGYALHEQGFAYCWSGARANVGIAGGKYCFGCTVVSLQSVDMEDTAPDRQNLCRLGISRGDEAVGNLGETAYSFGYGGTGTFSHGGKFSDYGEKFGLGDTIVCSVNLEDKSMASIGFSKNGKWLGRATYFDVSALGLSVADSPERKMPWQSAVFPHVLLKNVVVELQFSVEDGLVAEEGFKPWASALEDGNAVIGPVFSDPRDCEVVMMVGLPGSGKTTWAENWVKEHPEKRYVLLGTNLVLDQMKVPGLLRRNNYGERFDCLMNRATEIFNIILSGAATTPRNYIIDQTNVYNSARNRKLKPFALFRKIAVVVFPSPEELNIRSKKRAKEMGKEVPADAVNNMLANFILPVSKDMPGSDEFFDQVMFVELNREESQRYLDEMKQSLACKSDWKNSNNSSPYSVGPGFLISPNYGESPVQLSSPYSVGSYVPNFSPNYGESPMQRFTMPPLLPRRPVPGAVTPYGSYSGYFGSCGGVTDPYQSYGPGEPHSRQNIERNSTTFDAATNPYSSSTIVPSLVGSAMTSFTGNNPGYPRAAAPQDPRAPTFLPSPSPPAYGGLPFGTPAPRPPYGNSPVNTAYPGGYPLPGPRYY
ncbi:unnamed protein product [Prunus armeniaca]|uniref:SPRY domain-containing protein n=1 Tax=Prunus armeniaca TaxID=36596 RepID=A0A6J5UL10_PRUAR|nr:unnamed protein product [Prunus armeniaca]